MGDKPLISDDKFKKVIDHLHDEIMIFDNNYKVVYVNKASARHYGIDRNELIGKRFSELDETYWGNSTLPEVYEKKKKVAKRQVTNLGSDIVTISVPIRDQNGNLEYVGQNVNDIYDINTYDHNKNCLSDVLEKPEEEIPFISASEKTNSILETIKKIKNITSPCLLLGETGTGKSHLAQYIHLTSNRKNNSMVTLNCACLNPNLIEAELFGYVKGSFTGANSHGKKGLVEIADGGTLFLDEISELPLELQAKLLQFIQSQEFIPVGGSHKQKVNTRIIAASNRSLSNMVKQKAFREDLYFRLNTFEITMPPLRERKEDLEQLIDFYLQKFNTIHYRNCTISNEAREILCTYPWPGNIRQVGHTIEKTVVLTKNKEISIGDLPKVVFELQTEETSLEIDSKETLDDILGDVERRVIEQYYKKYKTSVLVAEKLGISQPKAYRLIKKYVLDNR